MSMKQNIEIDGKQVPFRASAAIPRIYRMKFHRDIYKDLRSLEKSIGDEHRLCDGETRRPQYPRQPGGMAGRI